MRRIFVIRHGNTFASSVQARRIGAGTDIPLVDSGQAQAQALAHWFAAQHLPTPRIYSGPLLRARQTAQPIANALGLELGAPLAWLDEIDHGPDEGRLEADVLGRIGPAAIADWDARAIAPDGWVVDADARIAAWRDWFAQAREGTDLLVTSNGAARFALLALGQQAGQLKLRTGAFGELLADGGTVRLIRWDERP